MGGPQLTILMPVFNERRTIEAAIADALGAELPVPQRELIVIDDGSTDGTREYLQQREWPDGTLLLLHERNRGKGAALLTGLARASGDFAGVLDADLEYSAADLGPMLAPLLDGTTEVVFGVRGFQAHSAFSFWYVVGNKAVTLAANVLFNSWVSDIMTGQKLMRTELFRSLRLTQAGFAIEPEITAELLRRGIRIYEVSAEYNARSRAQGKKLTASDGLRVLLTLVRCRLRLPPK